MAPIAPGGTKQPQEELGWGWGRERLDIPHPTAGWLPRRAPGAENQSPAAQDLLAHEAASSQKPASGERKGKRKKKKRKKGSQSSLRLSRDKNTAPPAATAEDVRAMTQAPRVCSGRVFPACLGVPSIYGMHWISLKCYKETSTNANPISLPLPVKTSGQQKQLGTFPLQITVFTEFRTWP